MPSKVVALALSTHPGPGLAVTAIAVILGAGIGIDPVRLVILGFAFLANQVSVGLSNDWLDADRDRAVGRTDKPVALGQISAGAVRTAAFLSAGAAVALTIPLGWAATVAHTVFIASAWAYNVGLKNTVFSVAPYILSFGLLPLVVTLANTEPALAAPWAIAAGALLGTAAHFANVLPDREDDRSTGIRGLPHRLGSRWSAAIISFALLGASTLVVAGPAVFDLPRLIGLGLVAVVAIVCYFLAAARAPTRLLFQLIIVAALITVLLLAFSGERMLNPAALDPAALDPAL